MKLTYNTKITCRFELDVRPGTAGQRRV